MSIASKVSGIKAYNSHAMDTGSLIAFIQESLFMIVVFGIFLGTAMVRGKYALINIILSLYLALLISLKFPYFSFFENGTDSGSGAVVHIVIFVIFTILGIILFRKHIPGDDYEPAFYQFIKKIILALMATILIMVYSFHVIPVTDLITPGTPIRSLFEPEASFFWWLMAPLITLLIMRAH